MVGEDNDSQQCGAAALMTKCFPLLIVGWNNSKSIHCVVHGLTTWGKVNVFCHDFITLMRCWLLSSLGFTFCIFVTPQTFYCSLYIDNEQKKVGITNIVV